MIRKLCIWGLLSAYYLIFLFELWTPHTHSDMMLSNLLDRFRAYSTFWPLFLFTASNPFDDGTSPNVVCATHPSTCSQSKTREAFASSIQVVCISHRTTPSNLPELELESTAFKQSPLNMIIHRFQDISPKKDNQRATSNLPMKNPPVTSNLLIEKNSTAYIFATNVYLLYC